jgi:hypothetical protein
MLPLKLLVGLGVAAGLGVLFARSARDARAKPYTVEAARLQGWTVALEAGAGPNEPMLVLRAPPPLVTHLFDQVFTRAMESLSAPGVAGIPLVLQREFDRAFAGRVTPQALAAAARAAGLDSATLEPRCLAYRRLSEPGVTRQLYFVLFDWPAFARFREQLAALAGGGVAGAAFDPAALSPVLLIGTAGPAFDWLPLRATPETDCVAPFIKG